MFNLYVSGWDGLKKTNDAITGKFVQRVENEHSRPLYFGDCAVLPLVQLKFHTVHLTVSV